MTNNKIKKLLFFNFALWFLIFTFAFSLYSYADTDIAVVEKPFMEGRYERAIYEADRLIDERVRQRQEVYYLKGLSELKLGRFNDARQDFQVIISRYSKTNRVFDAYLGIGDSYFLEGNHGAAIKAYKEIKEKFPSNKNIALVDARLSDCRPASAGGSALPAVEMPQGEPKGYISVQAGSFKNKRNAERLSAKLSAAGYESYVEFPAGAGDRLYRVKVGRLKSKADAESIASRLNRDGYRTKICDDSL